MKTVTIPFAILFLALAFLSTSASNAQGLKVGPQLGLNLDGSEIFVGLESQFKVPVMKDREVWGNLGFENYPFIDYISISTLNVDLLFPFMLGSVELYGGGGLAVRFLGYDHPENYPVDPSGTDVGLDVKAGWLLGSRSSGYRPFVEINQTIGAGSDFVVRAGVFLVIGGR